MKMELENKNQESLSAEGIRVDTIFSNFPIHNLGKGNQSKLEIIEVLETGKNVTKWKVSYSSEYGQPHSLGYKIDTLIVNKRIDESRANLSKIIKLGSLREIIKELGLSNANTNNIKQALYQNAFVGITAKLKYRATDKTEKTLEFGTTRYSVIFTGETLPDGRKADAVYILLNEIYLNFLIQSQTRPLDYDYLKKLPPTAQRFYELVSPKIYSHLKNKLPCAKLSYSYLCQFSPLTRYFTYDQVKKQMYKIHKPHKDSNYLETVKVTETVDNEQKPDWIFSYTAGTKAKEEFKHFQKTAKEQKREQSLKENLAGIFDNRLLDFANISDQKPIPKTKPTADLTEEEKGLLSQILEYGVSETKAKDLIKRSRLTAEAQILYYPYTTLAENVKNPSGWIIKAIENNYAPPESFKKEQTGIETRRRKEANKNSEDSKLQKELKKFEQAERKKELAKGKFESFSKERQTELFDRYKTRIIARDYKPEHLSLSFVQGLIDQQTYNEIYNDISAGKTF
jgi:hypothetical protein